MITHLVVQHNLLGKKLRGRVIGPLEFYKKKAKDQSPLVPIFLHVLNCYCLFCEPT
jgi:hypothetical protein